MSKKQSISEEEQELFKAAMTGVTPLKPEFKNIAEPKKAKSKLKHSLKNFVPRHMQQPELAGGNVHTQSVESVAAETSLYFARSGVQASLMQKMRRADLVVDAELDLHGFNVDQAYTAVQKLLARAVQQGWRCIRIIHGKGSSGDHQQPILKNRINHWLRDYDCVLGFCSAPALSGGKGAVNVLLKR
jgi:DNA-nicking Smr family endonuclease